MKNHRLLLTVAVMKPFILGALLFALSGCANDDGLNVGGKVSGKVTINDKLVTAGRVLFVGKDGKNAVPGVITGLGTYTIKEPPLGECRVAVETLHLRDAPRPTQPPPGKGNMPGLVLPNPNEVGMIYVPIPERYEKPETSNLTFTVPKGDSTWDIKLTK